jgi:hypothetical protein
VVEELMRRLRSVRALLQISRRRGASERERASERASEIESEREIFELYTWRG